MLTRQLNLGDSAYTNEMVSMDFSLYNFDVYSDYIYCEIAAGIEYNNAGNTSKTKMSGRGELLKLLFIKTVDGYRIAIGITMCHMAMMRTTEGGI